MIRIVWLLALLVSLMASPLTLAAKPDSPAPLVAAASSLRLLWPELIEHYSASTGNPEPRVSFASSGLLSTQISNGAPFDIFLSADIESIQRLPADRLLQPAKLIAQGSLSLVTLSSAELAQNLSLSSLYQLLNSTSSNTSARIAIPSPVHAPYGKAARDVLASASLWPLKKGQMLAAENASQTLQFLLSGAVDAAIVPRTLLAKGAENLVVKDISSDAYRPVEHYLAVVGESHKQAQEFATWILSEQSHAALRGFGLQVSGP